MGSNIFGRDGGLTVLDVLPEEGGHLEGGGLAAREVLHEILEREARVEDILDDQHVATLDIDIEVLDDAHDTRGLDPVTVARNGHEIDIGGQLDLTHEVAHEDDGAAQDGDQHQVLALIIAGNLLAQASNDLLDLVLCEQNGLDIRMLRCHDSPSL